MPRARTSAGRPGADPRAAPGPGGAAWPGPPDLAVLRQVEGREVGPPGWKMPPRSAPFQGDAASRTPERGARPRERTLLRLGTGFRAETHRRAGPRARTPELGRCAGNRSVCARRPRRGSPGSRTRRGSASGRRALRGPRRARHGLRAACEPAFPRSPPAPPGSPPGNSRSLLPRPPQAPAPKCWTYDSWGFGAAGTIGAMFSGSTPAFPSL